MDFKESKVLTPTELKKGTFTVTIPAESFGRYTILVVEYDKISNITANKKG